jgi:hypothetical protein
LGRRVDLVVLDFKDAATARRTLPNLVRCAGHAADPSSPSLPDPVTSFQAKNDAYTQAALDRCVTVAEHKRLPVRRKRARPRQDNGLSQRLAHEIF